MTDGGSSFAEFGEFEIQPPSWGERVVLALNDRTIQSQGIIPREDEFHEELVKVFVLENEKTISVKTALEKIFNTTDLAEIRQKMVSRLTDMLPGSEEFLKNNNLDDDLANLLSDQELRSIIEQRIVRFERKPEEEMFDFDQRIARNRQYASLVVEENRFEGKEIPFSFSTKVIDGVWENPSIERRKDGTSFYVALLANDDSQDGAIALLDRDESSELGIVTDSIDANYRITKQILSNPQMNDVLAYFMSYALEDEIGARLTSVELSYESVTKDEIDRILNVVDETTQMTTKTFFKLLKTELLERKSSLSLRIGNDPSSDVRFAIGGDDQILVELVSGNDAGGSYVLQERDERVSCFFLGENNSIRNVWSGEGMDSKRSSLPHDKKIVDFLANMRLVGREKQLIGRTVLASQLINEKATLLATNQNLPDFLQNLSISKEQIFSSMGLDEHEQPIIVLPSQNKNLAGVGFSEN